MWAESGYFFVHRDRNLKILTAFGKFRATPGKRCMKYGSSYPITRQSLRTNWGPLVLADESSTNELTLFLKVIVHSLKCNYFLFQAVACSLYTVGFGESIAGLIHQENPWVAKGIALGVTVLLLSEL